MIFILTPALRPLLVYNVDLYQSYITGVINIKILLHTFIIKAASTIVSPIVIVISA